MRKQSRCLLFGVMIAVLTTFVATSYAQFVPSMTPRKHANMRERPPAEARKKPLIMLIDENCGVELIAKFEFKRDDNKGKELKFWRGRPLIMVNKSGRVVIVRFGGGDVGSRAWSAIGRKAVRLNPGDVYRTRLRGGKTEGEAEFSVICAGKKPGEAKSESGGGTGWDGPPREPDEPPPNQGSGG